MSTSFERFAGVCAILTGLAGFCYSIAFIVVARTDPELGRLLSGLFLLVGGLLSSPVLVALYHRLRETDDAFALWAMLLGILGAAGSMMHGGYDLANAINPPAGLLTTMLADLPSQANPRGLFTFGLVGVARFVIASLIRRSERFPHSLGVLGYVSTVLLLVLYLGRLIILDPANPVIVVAALLEGFLINPLWYLWIGLVLKR
ncbi:MAG: hypothetical protein HY710_00955 [Candidatus Latescibacteria bacterium]|nr:hypothetical protein [Candidatus Latescibacterota bacterium]